MRDRLTAAASAAGVLLLWGCFAAQTDILGPLGPMQYEGSGFPVRRVLACLLAVGFAGVAAFFILRRARRDAATPPSVAVPAEDLGDLDAAEAYTRLLDAVRAALARHDGRPARALTPRELAARPSLRDAASPHPDRLRKLCGRAEGAQYARRRVDRAQIRADLELVDELLQHLASTGAARSPEADEHGA